MYAIVKTGGKQYRVEEGQSLLVEVQVQAKVLAHERGPKLRIVKFKPKRGYKRRTGHRQSLTRIEVTQIKLASRRSSSPKPVAAEPHQPTATTEAENGA
jgi:large subunit ribosomal protein L21